MDSAWDAALKQLESATPQQRSEAIEQVTELLQAGEWELPDGRAHEITSALRERLADSNWSVTQRCLLLVGDLVAELEPGCEMDKLVGAHLLVGLVTKVSDSKVVVRKAASQALVSYMQSTGDPEVVMRCLVQQGLEAGDWRQRQATSLFLSLSSTPLDGAAHMRKELVRALCALLVDQVEQVAQSGRQALGRVRLTVGESEFAACVRALPPPLRAALEGAESSDSNGAADGSENEPEFGFVNPRLMGALREVGNWQVRAQAIAELQQLLAKLPVEMLPRVAPHLAPFTELLTSFLEDTNFKISLTSLQMISDLLDRFSEHIRSGPDSQTIFLAIVPRLMDKFADNKIVIRQANFRLTKKLMAIVPPERALPSLLGYAQHPNSHIREQAISVLIQTLLSAPRQPLELYRPCLAALAAPLGDAKPKVRQAALEAAAVLHEVAGAPAFDGLLRELQLGEDKEARIEERIRQGRTALPTVSSDGLVEFTTQPGLGPSSVAALPPRVPSAGRDRGGATAALGGGGNGGGGMGGGGVGGVSPPTPEEPQAPSQPAPADFSELMEFTAGGRKIATSKGRLPWDMPSGGREGVASRGKAGRPAAVAPPLLEVAHEDSEMPPLSSLSARESRGGSNMRIEVPASSVGAGPLSAPSCSAPSQASASNGAGAGHNGGITPLPGHWEEEGDGPPGAARGGFSGTASPHRELGEQQKIQLWLPERVGAEAPAPDGSVVRPMPSRRAVSGGVCASAASSLTSSFDSAAAPRDSLKLLKRRQQNPLAASGEGIVDGAGAAQAYAPPGASSAGPRAVSAAGRAPQVRLPFEERQRSSSAPHKRTDGGSNQMAPGDRLDEGVRALEAGHNTESAPAALEPAAVGGAGGNGYSGEVSLRLGAASLGECGAMGGEDASRPPHTGAYPSRRSTSLLRARCGAGGNAGGGGAGSCATASGGDGGARGAYAEAPSAAPFGRGGVRRSGELNLQLDGVGVSRSAGVPEEDGMGSERRKGGAAPSGRGGMGSSQESPLQEVTQGGGLKVLEELRTEELKALPAPPPEATLRSLLEQLRSDDWSAHFDAINLLRRLVAWADESGSDGGLVGQLHSINLLLIGYADSLRSALAKNAVVCFRELFAYIGHKMEADLDLIVPVLIKKAGESNGFICDEANKALSTMVHSVSESRAIAALLGSASHRNPAARAKAAAHLAKALEVMGYGRLLHSKELERVLPVLPTLLSEGLSETRAAAKQIISGLTRETRSPPEAERLERALRRLLSEPAYRKTREALDAANARTAGGLEVNGAVGGMAGSGKRAEGRRGSGLSGGVEGRRASAHEAGAPAASASGGGEADLDSVLANLASSDWAQRKDGVTALAQLVQEQGDALRGRLLVIFDHLSPRLSDSNSKVNVAALQALQQMVPALREGLPSVASTLVPAVATSLASSNAQVRAITPGVLDALVAGVEHGALIQPFANCVLYSPPKARPAMVDKLREVSTSLYPSKPHLVVKHALPTAFRLLEDNRADLRPGTTQLLRTLHVLLGPALFEHAQRAPAAVQSRLAEVIQSV